MIYKRVLYNTIVKLTKLHVPTTHINIYIVYNTEIMHKY